MSEAVVLASVATIPAPNALALVVGMFAVLLTSRTGVEFVPEYTRNLAELPAALTSTSNVYGTPSDKAKVVAFVVLLALFAVMQDKVPSFASKYAPSVGATLVVTSWYPIRTVLPVNEVSHWNWQRNLCDMAPK